MNLAMNLANRTLDDTLGLTGLTGLTGPHPGDGE